MARDVGRGLGEPPGGVRVVRATGAVLEDASRRLVESSSPGDGDAGRRFVSAARSQGVQLGCFFAALGDGGEVLESALAVPGAGRAAMFFVSQPADSAGERALSAAVLAACGDLEGMVLAQALLLPAEVRAARVFEGAGFSRLASLGYLRWRSRRMRGGVSGGVWSVPAGWESALSSGEVRDGDVVVRRLSSVRSGDGDRRVRAALAASYEGTLDCPELCRMRDPSDVLASHRAVGEVDDRLWWLVERGEEPLGAVLWTPMRRSGTGLGSAELVYMGLGPGLRGRGLGSKLLTLTASDLWERGFGELTCAVDLSNTPARAMYERAGFRRYAERVAFVLGLVDGV